MKILLITWHTAKHSPSENGVSASWLEQLSKDHELTLLTVSRPGRYGEIQKEFPDARIIEWKDLDLKGSIGILEAIIKPTYVLFYFKMRKFLKKLIKEEHFDIIHHLSPFAWRYQSPAFGLGVPLVRGPVAGGLPLPKKLSTVKSRSNIWLQMINEFDCFRSRFDPFFRNSYSNTDHVIFAGPYVKNCFASTRIEGFSFETEHGIDVMPRPNLRKTNGPVRLLYVGRLTYTKGLHLLLKSLSLLQTKENWTLDVLGDGEKSDENKNLAKTLHLNEKVKFLGWKSRDIVDDYYRQADVFVFPSFREPTGGVIVEAMKHGLPIITCDYGGPGFMVSEKNAIKLKVVEQEEFIKSLSDAITLLIDNGKLRTKMGKASYQMASENFSWEKKRERITSIYQTTIAKT